MRKVGIVNLGQLPAFRGGRELIQINALGGLLPPKALSKKVLRMKIINNTNSSKNTNNLLVTPSESFPETGLGTATGIPRDKEWGIDTCTLSIPVRDDVPELAQNSWGQTEGKQNERYDKTTYVTNLSVGYADVRVAYMPIYSSIFVSFNSARILSRKSAELLPAGALKPLVESLLYEISPQLPVLPVCMNLDSHGTLELTADWEQQVKFTRLDCARNLYVDSPEYVKHALSNVTSKYQKVVHIYYDHEGWTRANQTKSTGMDRIYDKSAELRNLELDERFHWDKRVFRFECQLQGDRLSKFGLKTLDRVSDESVWNVLATRWDSCRWGIPMPGQASLDELLMEVPIKDRLAFIGFLSAKAEGLTDLIPRKVCEKHSRLARSLNLIPGFPLGRYRPMDKVLSLWHGGLGDGA